MMRLFRYLPAGVRVLRVQEGCTLLNVSGDVSYYDVNPISRRSQSTRVGRAVSAICWYKQSVAEVCVIQRKII